MSTSSRTSTTSKLAAKHSAAVKLKGTFQHTNSMGIDEGQLDSKTDKIRMKGIICSEIIEGGRLDEKGQVKAVGI